MNKHKLVKLLLLLLTFNSVIAETLNDNLVTVNGHQLHYYQIGASGRPLILLTGYATTSNFWNQDFVRCLAKEHSVYLLDYAGINSNDKTKIDGSIQVMAKDVNQFAEQLDLQHPDLIGWSMGGGVALEASFQAPDEYNHLYLLAPLVPGTESALLQQAKAHKPFKTDADILNYVFGRNLYNYQSNVLNYYRAQFIESGLSALFPDMAIIKSQDQAVANWVHSTRAETSFQSSQVPATFYIPEHDQIIDQDIAKLAINQYSNFDLISVRQSGHAVSFQLPIAICNDILKRSMVYDEKFK